MTTLAFNDFVQKVKNKYLDFMDECKQKAELYSSEQLSQCYTHHIVPRHHSKKHKLNWETFENPQNLVKLTFEDHIQAHKLRFEVYGEFGDKAAFTRMQGLEEEGMKTMQQAGGQAANELFKREKRQMFSREFQTEMAKRSMARPDAFQIRSVGGKKGNREKSKNKTVRVEDKYLWYVEKQPFLCTFGFDNGGDLLRELYKAKPTKLQRISPLIKGTKKSLQGWSCEKISFEKESAA